MGGFLQAVAGGIAAARDPAAAQQQIQQKQDDALKLQIAPLTQAIQADRQKLVGFMDDKGNVIPEHQKDYDATVKSMSEMLGRMRGLLGQKQPGDDPNHFESTVAGLTDRLHITRDLAHQLKTRQQQKQQQWSQQNTQMAQDTAAGALPFAMTPEGQEQAAKTRDAQALETQKATDAQALEKIKEENRPVKAPKEDGPLDTGGIFYGVRSGGKEYLPSQLTSEGDAPPEAKQIWQTIQAAKAQKEAAEHRKEDEAAERQARTIAAGFERMGRAQEFQENMAQYRSDLSTYRALSKAADDSETNVKALEEQYAQPGNKAAADNELQNFYTSVVQKGGRKTAAELGLTLKIGSLGLNLEQAFQKARTGELPDQLRKELLNGMKAVAQEQRKMAEQTKPELPEIKVPEGPKTKALKQKMTGSDHVEEFLKKF